MLVVLSAVGLTGAPTLARPHANVRPAASQPAPRVGGVLNVAAQVPPAHLDPAQGGGELAWEMHNLSFNTLVTYASTSEAIVPSLATHWRILDHGLEYIFYLRHGVRFQNGDPLTAQDVVFTFTRMNEKSVASPIQSLVADIVGANAVFAGKTKVLSGIRAVGTDEVVMHLVQPENYWLNIVAWNQSSIVDPRTASTLNTDPVGTGPYIFVTSHNETDYVFKRNPNYWDKPYPYLSEINVHIGPSAQLQVQRFERGVYNAVLYPFTFGLDPADYLALQRSPFKKDYSLAPEPGLDYVGFNVTVAPYNNLALRQAIEYALNPIKSLVSREAFNGRAPVLNSLLSPGYPGYSPTMNLYPAASAAQDVAKAKALLNKAHYHGQTLTLTYPTGSSQTQLAQAVEQGLQAAGIQVLLRPVSQPVFQELGAKPKGLGMYIDSWIIDYPNPQDVLFNLFSGSQRGGNNFDWYNNATVNRLLNQADAMVQMRSAMPIYLKVERMLLAQAVVVPLVETFQDQLIAPNLYPKSNWIWLHPVMNTQLWEVWWAPTKR